MAAAPTRAHRKRERGTTLTEAAFVTFPFFFIIFGIMEMGFLFRNYLTVSNAAAEAGRAASVSGSDQDADFLILRSAEHGIAAMGVDQLEYIVIWRAEGPGDEVPSECKPDEFGGTKTSFREPRNTDPDLAPLYLATDPECNVYRPADFGLNLFDFDDDDGDGDSTEATVYFGCSDDADTVDWGWCPKVRMDSLSDDRALDALGNVEEGTDYVGIYVQAKHKFLTGFFQNETTLGSSKIVRIEPVGQ